MSLFGTSPDDAPPPNPASRSTNSLFAEDDAGSGGDKSRSLFGDDDGDGGGHDQGKSPWEMPTPRKGGSGRRADVVKTLLANADVPESYVELYDEILGSGDRVGAGVSLTSVRRVLDGSSGLKASVQSDILGLVLPGGEEEDSSTGLGRGEFNVLLALIGLAQEGEEISLDAVDERRQRLPLPKLELEKRKKKQDTTENHVSNQGQTSPPQDESMEFPESDPWGAPAQREAPTSDTNHTRHDDAHEHTPVTPKHTEQTSASPSQPGWGSSNPTGFGADGFGQDGLGGDTAGSSGRGTASRGTEEVVTVNTLPDKEGMFLFQHRNYEVASIRRGSKVVRRYSDFVWLLDCLNKRYPFRQLPLLPPKRVAVNGNHLSSDASFIEKRRRGLVRFVNGLIRHPVLSQEQLVVMFLTVPTELAVWRKQATISVQEEFAGKSLPPTLEDSLPASLEETFERVRSGVQRSAELYINYCNLLERLTKRNEGLAADYLRISLALHSLTETSADTYAIDTNDVPLLNTGLVATAKHHSTSQSLLEDEAKAWDVGVLEDVKRQRDTLVSLRDLFDRRDRLAVDNIPQLERRIEKNETRLAGLRNRAETKPGEIERVEDAIIKDKQSIVAQHARGVFIKECVRDELQYFQQSQYHVARLHQDWSQERVKYTELQTDNWRGLADELESMPTE